ncbi:hypothetical protein ASPWEDRAFT_166998 [Aspergillus wentii DTO 134E9]|uniref:Telomere-associated protein Rif1 N-terminal domain-containing protein n=1 Tax=Aspergillus wentii DTO 134E9 TaxID=1073089 RepID=A0A1L9S1D6_ASPWE|nr:uncharacterized protein ASPWEDRAFT_166998 [Aspergillus wentii DTO 134E9]KAI9931052.1 hypothetical protein MW887_010707 [Aspergillus wentii]OJJ40954.1 hypothetical protein ASPWEDRAFT_166998 [Aspergillus wentii DTO 134E9]
MVEALGPLSARPPTPPRTTPRMLPNEAKDRLEGSPAVLQTPGDSPYGSAGVPSSRHSKRVNFSPWTKYIKPPTFTNSTLKSQADLKALPPSNECKPSKSILKATHAHAPVSSPNDAPFTSESFAMLLESITKQLAGGSTSERLDAYMHFFSALRAYDDLPSDREISGKLGLVTQFIQRDVTRDLQNGGPLDTNLVIQALKLSAALVWHPEISKQLSDDFKVFLVDHSMSCLQDAKVSKSVVTNCMPILSTHNFPAKIMTTARLTRLLTALNEVTSRVSGSAIVTQRLSIYHRILTQSKSTFVSHSSQWMDHLVSGLLHPLKDTRVKAIALGFHISMVFGPNPALSKSIRDCFDRPLENNRKMVAEICERMSRMMASQDSGVHVPQIWSVIILLLRSKRSNVDQWEHFKELVLVLQKCFNCSEPAIKAQAMTSWNRFVYVVSPNEATSPSIIKMLSRPILSQFERKKQDKQMAQLSQVALSSYYNLVYYAFRPSTSHQHLDFVWEEYIASPSAGVFSSAPMLNDRFSLVLSNMLWSPQAKVWFENKANDNNKLDPEELPSLDCKWIRSRITSILKVFENIFKSSVWADGVVAIEKSNIATAWTSLSRALSYASSKEITPSAESMHAVASVLGLLQRLWNAGPSSLNATDTSFEKFFERFRFLSTTMIFSLGSIPFTEKLLLKTDETFQAANTPTHRHSRGNSNPDSPILHFLRIISDVSGISEPTPSYMRLINGTLEAACNGKTSRGSRLEIIRQCADLHPNEAEFHFGVHSYAQIVWKSTAQLAADCLRSFPIESARERDGSVLRDYENIVKILSAGLKFSDVSQVWNQLLDSFVRVVRTEKGDRAIATVAMEPLAECVMRLRVRDAYLPSTSLLSNSLSIPYCQQEASNPKETGSHSAGNEQLLFPHKLVELVERTLQESYGGFNASETSGIADFIESLTSFLGSGILTFRSSILETLQQPLALWIRDEVRQLNVESGVESRILTAIRALSSAVLNILQASTPHDAVCLQKFETIICAGLDSSHMSIAKRFVEMWRSSFGLQESLACPMSISRALVKLELYMKNQPPPDSQAQDSSASQDKESSTEALPKSRKGFVLGETPNSTGFTSSPVTQVIVNTELSPEQVIERRPLRSGGSSDQLAGDELSLSLPTGSKAHRQRNEVFSMIESLRSSSPPVNTPRELGFMTPPHMRNLRNAETENETPLTPTLPAPAENEDGFLGSSPTPGTRGRAQASESGSELSSLSDQNLDVDMIKEPPSSPPELKSHNSSPTGNKDAKNTNKKETPNRSRSKSRKENRNDETPVETNKPTTRRLRSSASKNPSSGKSETNPSPEKASREKSDTQGSKAGSKGAAATPKSAGKNKGRSRKNEKKNEPEPEASDGSTDDMETQIASQLEQDMGLATDAVEDSKAEQLEELPNSFPMTKKRKREVETQTPRKKERRRSSRISSVKEPDADDTQEPRSTRATRSFNDLPTANPSPAVSSSKKRKGQAKVDTEESTGPNSIEQDQGIGSKDKSSRSRSRSARKRRRSGRLEGVAAPPIPEESPSQKKSPRLSSRKSDRRHGETKASKQELPKEQPVADETMVLDQEKEHQEPSTEPNDDVHVQESAESHDPVNEIPEILVDNQMNKPEPQNEPVVEDDITMKDAEAVDDQSRHEATEHISQGQIEEADSNESGILSSLRKVLDDAKSAKLDRGTVKEIDELLFDIRVEALEALKRHTE